MRDEYFMSRNKTKGSVVFHACRAVGQGDKAVLSTYCGRQVINPTARRRSVELCGCEKCLEEIAKEAERSGVSQ